MKVISLGEDVGTGKLGSLNTEQKASTMLYTNVSPTPLFSMIICTDWNKHVKKQRVWNAYSSSQEKEAKTIAIKVRNLGD